jgi:hypothetical protein
MRSVRFPFRLAVGACLLATIPAGAASIFHDGFEAGDTCFWSYLGASDSCPSSRLYAHSGTDLYRIDTDSLDEIPVGAFNTGGPGITDIAIDRNGLVFAVSLAKLWSIDPSSGAATEVGNFDGSDGRNSLAFVPLDGSDPLSAERLVTAGTSGDVHEVNPATGALTLLGNFGLSSGNQIRSAGDLVSIRGLGTFAAVTIGDTPGDADYLASVNTTTWIATLIGATSTGFDRVFGLGFWAGTFYGFVDDGAGAGTGTTITIDEVTGIGSIASSAAFRWIGAGVATNAPLGE